MNIQNMVCELLTGGRCGTIRWECRRIWADVRESSSCCPPSSRDTRCSSRRSSLCWPGLLQATPTSTLSRRVCVLSLVSNSWIYTSHLTEYVIPANTNYISASYNKRPRNKIQL